MTVSLSPDSSAWEQPTHGARGTLRPQSWEIPGPPGSRPSTTRKHGAVPWEPQRLSIPTFPSPPQFLELVQGRNLRVCLSPRPITINTSRKLFSPTDHQQAKPEAQGSPAALEFLEPSPGC